MKSSYLCNDLNYGDIINASLFNLNPKLIVEFGILQGFSLKIFAENFPNADIRAYDIFDKFNGNSADKNIIELFREYKNVKIDYGDFYEKYKEMRDIDILHVDIANNGDVLEFVIENYLPNMSKNGLIIFEGGSKERDEVEWMNKFNKKKINPVIEKLKNRLDIKIRTIGQFPSITFLKKDENFNIHELNLMDFDKGFFSLVNYFTKKLEEDSLRRAKENINLFNNDNVKTLVVEYNGKIIGTGKIYVENKIHNNLKNVGHIEDMIIDEDFRKNNVGTLILKRLIEIGRDNNCYKIILDCHPEVSSFYEKNGFIKKGTEMCIYY